MIDDITKVKMHFVDLVMSFYWYIGGYVFDDNHSFMCCRYFLNYMVCKSQFRVQSKS